MTAMPKQTGELRACIARVLPLLFLCGAAGAQQEPFSISVDVNFVVLHATVHDSRGRDVLNLRQQDFKLYEDGAAQEVRWFRREDTPVTAGLIVDHSGSMLDKLQEVTQAARIFAQSSNPMDQMFVINFNEKVLSGLPGVSPFTDRPAVLEGAIAGAPAEGQTALYDAIAAGLGKLKQGDWDKKVLVVISDGGDNASTNTLAGIMRMAEQSSALIYTIGVFSDSDPDKNPGVLKRLAEVTGGEAFLPKQFTEVPNICAHIAEDIRNQYMIGYSPSNTKPDGAHHIIRLVAEAPGQGKLRVRTRTGYIAQGASE